MRRSKNKTQIHESRARTCWEEGGGGVTGEERSGECDMNVLYTH